MGIERIKLVNEMENLSDLIQRKFPDSESRMTVLERLDTILEHIRNGCMDEVSNEGN